MKKALLSVFYKDGIVEFAQGLIKFGYEIISSGGTARHLKEHGVPNVTDVADITGYPAILGHRVVTLHPAINGGILAELTDEHDEELEKYDIPRIDIVCVDVYPVWEALKLDRVNVSQVMQKTDIGGPTMLRGAAKNHDNCVAPICNPNDRQRVLEDLENFGHVSTALRQELAFKVFDLTTRYDASIRNFMGREAGILVDSIILGSATKLAYAENRCQNPAHMFTAGEKDPLAITNFRVESGNPSYISIADASQLVDIICLLQSAFKQSFGKTPFITVAGKHGNPCGAGISWTHPYEAIEKALLGDGVAVMGGEVVANFHINSQLAKALFYTGIFEDRVGRKKWGLDIVLAPSFTFEAIDLLGERERRRLLSNPLLESAPEPVAKHQWRQIRGAWLRQRMPDFVLLPNKFTFQTGEIDKESMTNILIAWACCWRASSNTVSLAKDNMLLGLGCGQQDRIACVRLCLDRALRAGHDTKGSYFASDGFFPYSHSIGTKVDNRKLKAMKNWIDRAIAVKDPKEKLAILANKAVKQISEMDNREGPELLISAGCAGGMAPADGKNFTSVFDLFQKYGLKVGFIAPQYRGFSKH